MLKVKIYSWHKAKVKMLSSAENLNKNKHPQQTQQCYIFVNIWYFKHCILKGIWSRIIVTLYILNQTQKGIKEFWRKLDQTK